jgi:hypothetical protein
VLQLLHALSFSIGIGRDKLPEPAKGAPAPLLAIKFTGALISAFEFYSVVL